MKQLYELEIKAEGFVTVHEGDDIPEGYTGPIVPREDTEENQR